MPKVIYKTQDGKRVPSVTRCLKNLDKPGLLYWANQAGLEGLTLEEARARPLGIGTMAHILIEAECKKKSLDLSPTAAMDPKVVLGATNALEMFRRWRETNRFSVLASELSLVSETLRVGGTLDMCAKGDVRRAMVDWKVTKEVYKDAWIQVAAYGMIWEENHPDQPIEEYVIIRLGKDTPELDHLTRYPDSDCIVHGRAAFRALRELHGSLLAMEGKS